MARFSQARRDELSRQRGFANYYEERKARAWIAGYESYPAMRKARAEGRPLPTDKEGMAALTPYQRRNARARALGYESYSAQRKARAEGRPLAGDTGRYVSRRQVHRFGDHLNVETTSRGRGWGVILAQLRAHPDSRVSAVVQWRGPSTDHAETELWRKGWQASAILDAADGTAEGLQALLIDQLATRQGRGNSDGGLADEILWAQFRIEL